MRGVLEQAAWPARATAAAASRKQHDPPARPRAPPSWNWRADDGRTIEVMRPVVLSFMPQAATIAASSDHTTVRPSRGFGRRRRGDEIITERHDREIPPAVRMPL